MAVLLQLQLLRAPAPVPVLPNSQHQPHCCHHQCPASGSLPHPLVAGTAHHSGPASVVWPWAAELRQLSSVRWLPTPLPSHPRKSPAWPAMPHPGLERPPPHLRPTLLQLLAEDQTASPEPMVVAAVDEAVPNQHLGPRPARCHPRHRPVKGNPQKLCGQFASHPTARTVPGHCHNHPPMLDTAQDQNCRSSRRGRYCSTPLVGGCKGPHRPKGDAAPLSQAH
mmetsp:Transcript_113810/g.294742  ORF Transcript_113810/g.294742 Transcript_113810/m.294742 type:complete len:223 (+) Transcript_113810:429-1097(+)